MLSRYKELHDPANGVNVDEGSGTVATRKRTDRESPYVNDNFYIIIVHATDDGKCLPKIGVKTHCFLISFLLNIGELFSTTGENIK